MGERESSEVAERIVDVISGSNLQRAVQDLGALERIRANSELPHLLDSLCGESERLERLGFGGVARLADELIALLQPGEVSR